MTETRLRRLVLAAWALAFLLGGAMLLVIRPEFLRLSRGREMLDARPAGYTLLEVRELISALGRQGLDYYAHVALPLDLVFPLAYGVAIGVSIILLQRGIGPSRGRVVATLRSVLYAAPFLAMIFDYWENRMIWEILSTGIGVSKDVVAEASRTTTYKWVFLAIAIFGLVVSATGALLRRRGQGPRRSR